MKNFGCFQNLGFLLPTRLSFMFFLLFSRRFCFSLVKSKFFCHVISHNLSRNTFFDLSHLLISFFLELIAWNVVCFHH